MTDSIRTWIANQLTALADWVRPLRLGGPGAADD